MSVVKRNEKTMEDSGMYPYDSETTCLECRKPLFDDGRPMNGGYHQGATPAFLCARYSDLHVLGYIIGDALIAGDYPNRTEKWPFVVDKTLDKLRSSILQAMLLQVDPMEYPWQKKK